MSTTQDTGAPGQPVGGSLTVSAAVVGASVPGQPTPYEWKQMSFVPAVFTADEVPVAARIPSSYTFPSVRGDGTADIRVADGSFFHQRVDVDCAPLTVGTPHLGDHVRLYFDSHESDQEATAAMLTGAAGIISIDGHLWTRIEEPVLVLHPDGIWIDVVPDTIISKKVETFALTESGQAVARAAELRIEAGTGAEPYPSAVNPKITVLVPSAFSTGKAGHGN